VIQIWIWVIHHVGDVGKAKNRFKYHSPIRGTAESLRNMCSVTPLLTVWLQQTDADMLHPHVLTTHYPTASDTSRSFIRRSFCLRELNGNISASDSTMNLDL
jgi:hypothetical protein